MRNQPASAPQIDLLHDLPERLEGTASTARAASEDSDAMTPSGLSWRLGRTGRVAGEARELAESLVASRRFRPPGIGRSSPPRSYRTPAHRKKTL